MKKTKYTEEQKEDLKNMDSTQLEEKYGWIPSKVSRLRRDLGIKGYPLVRKEKIPVPKADELEGKTLREVQEEFDVCRKTAIQWFSTRSVSYTRKDEKYNKEIARLKKIIKMLRLAFIFPYLRDAEIARAFKMSREGVRQIRKKLGINYIGDKLEFPDDDKNKK